MACVDIFDVVAAVDTAATGIAVVVAAFVLVIADDTTIVSAVHAFLKFL